MKSNKFNYITIQEIIPDKQFDLKSFSNYLFFSKAFLLYRDRLAVPGEQTLRRDTSLDVWKEIYPVNGKYVFEIAVRLPFFLPKLKGENEYLLRFNGREYAISNRHCEFVLDNSDNSYWLSHYLFQNEITSKTNAKAIQTISAKSLVITKFESQESTASVCIEKDFNNWLHVLNHDIPCMIQGMRYNLNENSYDLPDCNDIGRLCPVHVVCIGKDIAKYSALTIASHLGAYTIQSLTKLNCEADAIEAFCNGTTKIDYCRLVLRKATYLYHTGEWAIACILACSTCETLLTEWLRDKLYRNGLSKNKEQDAFNDIRFSQLLNLMAYFLMDMKDTEHKEAIYAINAMRKLRNDLVHKNKQVNNKQEIEKISRGIAAVETLIDLRNRHSSPPEGN